MTALVIGGGPAGIATAGWLARYEAPYRWIDRSGELGGMLRTVHNPIVDFPGVDGDDGLEVAETLAEWARRRMDPPVRAEVERIVCATGPAPFEVTVDGRPETYETVVIATGTRRRKLGVPGEDEGEREYVFMSTTRNPEAFRGCRVAVIGGADGAVEGCLNLARAGAGEVILIARSSLAAQRHFIEELNETSAIRQHPHQVEVTGIERASDGCRLHLDDGDTLDVDAAFVRIGVEPTMPLIDTRGSSVLERDDDGFVIVDGRCRTSIDRLYAVGDVTSTPLRSIGTCLGDAARAGRSVAETLGIWR